MMKVWMLAAVVLLVGGAWTPAEACACGATPPPSANMTALEMEAWHRDNMRREITAAYDKSFAVFSGEVISDAYVVRVRFRRDRVWKGTLPEFFWMKTGATLLPDGSIMVTSCDFGLPIGDRFLIFAYGTSIETMRTGSCSFSSLLKHATTTIEVLDALVKERAARDRARRQERQDANRAINIDYTPPGRRVPTAQPCFTRNALTTRRRPSTGACSTRSRIRLQRTATTRSASCSRLTWKARSGTRF